MDKYKLMKRLADDFNESAPSEVRLYQTDYCSYDACCLWISESGYTIKDYEIKNNDGFYVIENTKNKVVHTL